MKNHDLLEAIGNVNDECVRKAKGKKKTGHMWYKWGTIAACICLMMAVTVVVVYQIQNRNNSNSPDDPPVIDNGTNSGTTPGTDNPPNSDIGDDITKLTAEMLSSNQLTGVSSKSIGDASAGDASSQAAAELVPPHFPVDQRCIILTARAVEALPDTYETLVSYGSTGKTKYRIYRMEIVDPLDSGLSGEFYYVMYEYIFCDLTKYDKLLMAVTPYSDGNNIVFCNTSTNELTSFSLLFYCASWSPEYWTILPFTNDVFDESLWLDNPKWKYVYDQVAWQLDEPDDYDHSAYGDDIFVDVYNEIYVRHGSTYDAAVEKIRTFRAKYLAAVTGDKEYYNLKIHEYTSPKAVLALEYMKPFVNGVFSDGVRYINGCPTNEYYRIMLQNGVETVYQSKYKFEAADMENLIDVAAYVESLDLSALTAPHINTAEIGKIEKSYCSAAGWYEKTDRGVECMVKVYWVYRTDSWSVYKDDMYIRLTSDGAMVLTREEAKELLGSDCSYISDFVQGEEIALPMA